MGVAPDCSVPHLAISVDETNGIQSEILHRLHIYHFQTCHTTVGQLLCTTVEGGMALKCNKPPCYFYSFHSGELHVTW